MIFFGTPDFAVFGLEALLTMPDVQVRLAVTQPDKPAGRGGKIQQSPVKRLAESRSIPVLQPRSLRKELPAFLEQAAPHGPFDLGVVIAFGQILPQAVLDMPRRGCVNSHASLLPRWRGAAPIHRALMSGDAETGVCLMKMDAGLDTGPVYSREAVPIGPQDNLLSLHDRLGRLGGELLRRDLAAIAAGEVQAETQPEEGVTYAAKVLAAEAKIDWQRDALEISRAIRALSPQPGAYTMLRGERMKILAAEPRTRRSSAPDRGPGAISFLDSRGVEVQCGSDVLALLEVQLEGRKRMPVADFLRGSGVTPDSVMGE